MQTIEKNTKKMQTYANKQTVGGARQQYVTEERTRDKKWQRHNKNRHGMYCTQRERGRGNGAREDEVNTRSKQKKIVQLSRRTIATILIQTNL